MLILALFPDLRIKFAILWQDLMQHKMDYHINTCVELLLCRA